MLPRSPFVEALVAAVLAALTCLACGSGAPYSPPRMTPEEIELERLRALEKAGDVEGAVAGYRAMCLASPPSVRACYDLSRALDEAGRKEEAIAASAAFVTEHPDHGLAPSAVERMARAYRDLGREEEGTKAIEALAASIEGRDAWDSALYEVARLHRAKEDVQSETAALERIRSTGRWGSQLWDNAMWRLVEIMSEQGRRGDEKRILAELIGTMERSYLIASYNSPYHGEAILRLGRIHFDEGELERARELFMRLADWETSRLRDDGHLWAAKVDLRRGKTGRACVLLVRILEEMPDADSRREARKLADTASCPGGHGQ